MRKLFLLLFLVGCTESPNIKIETHETDSIIVKSEKTVVTSGIVFKKSDSIIDKKVNSVVGQISSLREENKALTRATAVKVEKIIRDTVYIETKKNFWGKTKTNTSIKSDSTETVDSLNN